nr:hypothetical protein Iba_chr05dCG12420 [Ipomoea batatas]
MGNDVLTVTVPNEEEKKQRDEVAPPQFLLIERASRALVPSPERRWLRRNSSSRRHRSALTVTPAMTAPSCCPTVVWRGGPTVVLSFAIVGLYALLSRSATPSSPSRCLSPAALSPTSAQHSILIENLNQ